MKTILLIEILLIVSLVSYIIGYKVADRRVNKTLKGLHNKLERLIGEVKHG